MTLITTTLSLLVPKASPLVTAKFSKAVISLVSETPLEKQKEIFSFMIIDRQLHGALILHNPPEKPKGTRARSRRQLICVATI